MALPLFSRPQLFVTFDIDMFANNNSRSSIPMVHIIDNFRPICVDDPNFFATGYTFYNSINSTSDAPKTVPIPTPVHLATASRSLIPHTYSPKSMVINPFLIGNVHSRLSYSSENVQASHARKNSTSTLVNPVVYPIETTNHSNVPSANHRDSLASSQNFSFVSSLSRRKSFDSQQTVTSINSNLHFSSDSITINDFEACREFWFLSSLHKWFIYLLTPYKQAQATLNLKNEFAIKTSDFTKTLEGLFSYYYPKKVSDSFLIDGAIELISSEFEAFAIINYIDTSKQNIMYNLDPNPDMSGVLTDFTPCYSSIYSDHTETCYSLICPHDLQKDFHIYDENGQILKIKLKNSDDIYFKMKKGMHVYYNVPESFFKTKDPSTMHYQNKLFELIRNQARFIYILKIHLSTEISFINMSTSVKLSDGLPLNELRYSLFDSFKEILTIHENNLLKPLLQIMSDEGPFIKKYTIFNVILEWVRGSVNPWRKCLEIISSYSFFKKVCNAVKNTPYASSNSNFYLGQNFDSWKIKMKANTPDYNTVLQIIEQPIYTVVQISDLLKGFRKLFVNAKKVSTEYEKAAKLTRNFSEHLHKYMSLFEMKKIINKINWGPFKAMTNINISKTVFINMYFVQKKDRGFFSNIESFIIFFFENCFLITKYDIQNFQFTLIDKPIPLDYAEVYLEKIEEKNDLNDSQNKDKQNGPRSYQVSLHIDPFYIKNTSNDRKYHFCITDFNSKLGLFYKNKRDLYLAARQKLHPFKEIPYYFISQSGFQEKIYCIDYVYVKARNTSYTLLGTSKGIYSSQDEKSWKMIFSMPNITSMQYIDSKDTLLFLSDGNFLKCSLLELLNNQGNMIIKLKKLERCAPSKNVQYFSAKIIKGNLFLLYMIIDISSGVTNSKIIAMYQLKNSNPSYFSPQPLDTLLINGMTFGVTILPIFLIVHSERDFELTKLTDLDFKAIVPFFSIPRYASTKKKIITCLPVENDRNILIYEEYCVICKNNGKGCYPENRAQRYPLLFFNIKCKAATFYNDYLFIVSNTILEIYKCSMECLDNFGKELPVQIIRGNKIELISCSQIGHSPKITIDQQIFDMKLIR
ncbi:uncharacterized protein ASCRUDRAFT_70985 [Ascoidea rubescens DSM 1968]|uniref:CNH domain-containing protein n=1 Tax=Ascoidea rubescens DSM 1968 TaxID=1344418 RepID=A0A1D2VG49_9ASCO|nr:hypothetical protein ASCRUDRAFT_70985 [Ascoidea rubescens DSM 1968]ODV60483.1 hypothetical protein ASCRUDRAFT_70985 [Ascoidea rubescens DSM 1968]